MLKGEGNFVKTTVPLHQQILDDEYFCTGNIDTQFIKKRLPIYAAAPKKLTLEDKMDPELAERLARGGGRIDIDYA